MKSPWLVPAVERTTSNDLGRKAVNAAVVRKSP